MYETVLVPTDGSDAVERTLPHALGLAADHDATVHALYVVDGRVLRAHSDDLRAEMETELRTEGEAAVEAVAERAADAGVDCVTEVREGTPDKTIVQYAEDVDADVIVIGPQGKTAREKIQRLGSVSDRVVDEATTSVFLVKESPTDE